MKTVYVVVAHDQTAYRLVKVFATMELAEKCKVMLKERLWQRITINKCSVVDE